MEKALSVSLLSHKISNALTDIGPVLVQGELSQARVHPSGHFYATLKDSESIISVVMWRSTVVRNGALPKEGASVLVRGNVAIYAPRGQYQIVASKIQSVGEGDLAARFEAMKAKLTAEGLFAEENKIELPFLPRVVGLATAPGSAALADMLHSLRARFPRMSIVHAHCLVQGPDAARSIVAAIRSLDQRPGVDVIICGRGGGSLEDLWAFNEESVVRASASCRTPIVSAVGHETDFTLADFAADVRAKTPTAAAEMVVPVEEELREQLKVLKRQLNRGIDQIAQELRERLKAYFKHRALTDPEYQVKVRRQRLDELTMALNVATLGRLDEAKNRAQLARVRLFAASPQRLVEQLRVDLAANAKQLTHAARQSLARGGERMGSLAGRLHALSPLAVIARGYSVLRDEHNHVVRQLAQAPPGSLIQARVVDGWILANVEKHKPQRLNEAD
jgi:exodeoxyribonuclease VII large subunit